MNYTSQARCALSLAGKAAADRGHVYIGTEHLLLGLLREGQGTAAVVLTEAGVKEERLSQLMEELIMPSGDKALLSGKPGYSVSAEEVLHLAAEEAARGKDRVVGTEHILMAILQRPDCVAARLLVTMDISIPRLWGALLRASGVSEEEIRESVNSFRSGQAEQAATPFLDQYSRDLTELARNRRLDPVIGREREIDRIMQILTRRKKNNPCLIGEPGVGKTAVVEGLAQRIVAGQVPGDMRDLRLVVLDLAGMVAGSKYRGEFEERIRRLLQEVTESRNILMFIDELHTIIGAGGAEGALDASNILKPSLSRGELQLIGATTITEYRKYIEKDAALERRFQPVMIEEPSTEETLDILKGLRPFYEEHHAVSISDEALDAAARLSTRYINDRFQPDKAIDLIDEASSRVQMGSYEQPEHWTFLEREIAELSALMEKALQDGDMYLAKSLHEQQKKQEKALAAQKKRAESREKDRRLVTEADVAACVSVWTGIPAERIAEAESRRLAHLEETLHRRVVGQEEAVQALAKAVRRGRVGLKDPARPIGSFLFLGPTGVGKTELSKALAEAVFGSEEALIRVDMSEYMEKHSVSKMIGSPPGYVGYDEGGQLSEKIRRRPYSVLLFDEIEKAHPDVFNILLQVLDDGHITDAQGRKVSFRETVIIMTSNAGAGRIIEPKKLGFLSTDDEKADYNRMKQAVMEEVRRTFRPEFLNRIDDIIVFHALNKENMRQITDILLRNLCRRCESQMKIQLTVTPKAKDRLIEESFDSKYGARPLKRAIQNRIENPLAMEILEGRVHEGDRVSLRYLQGAWKFRVLESPAQNE